jgi:hypothetical protein
MLYDENLIVTYLKEQTNYYVGLTDDTVGVQTNLGSNEVKIYIGHIGHTVRDAQFIWANGYSEFDNDLMLKTQVLILCKRTELVEVWNKVNKLLCSFTPFPGIGTYSCMTLLESGLQAQAGGKVFWTAHYGLIVPRIA